MAMKESANDERQTWLCKAGNEVLENMKAKSSDAKREVVCRLEALSTQVQNLVDSNEKNEDNTKCLFIVDIEGFKRKESETMSKLETFRDEVFQELVNKENLIESLLEQHVRCMEDYLQVYEICQDPGRFLPTFPLLKLEERQRRRLNCVTILRLNDIVDAKGSVDCKSGGCDEDHSVYKHIIGWRGEKKERYTVHDNSSYSLLYPQQSVVTTFQRTMQRELLRQTLRETKESFNKEVANLRRDKEKLQNTWEDLASRVASS